MNISVELTLTPLKDDFEPAIINFIKSLRSSGATMIETPLSTQVFGDYDIIMKLLTEKIKPALASIGNGLIHMKIVTSDRSDYEPNF